MHLPLDIRLLDEDHTRIFGWDHHELWKRRNAWDVLHTRALKSGMRDLAAALESRADLWRRVLDEYCAHGLQASLDLAVEMLQEVDHQWPA
jgi:hypothetical protein